MNSMLPIIKKNSLFSKICLALRNVFKSKKSTQKKEDLKICLQEKDEEGENAIFVNSLKNGVIQNERIFLNMDIDRIINEIEKNPDILNSLSINELKKLDKYYDKIILDYKKKLDIA